jgi:hypothetical protein
MAFTVFVLSAKERLGKNRWSRISSRRFHFSPTNSQDTLVSFLKRDFNKDNGDEGYFQPTPSQLYTSITGRESSKAEKPLHT